MAATGPGQGGQAGIADALLGCITALPPTLAGHIAATAEALHILAPFCQPQAPLDVLAVARAHRRVSLLGRAQRQAAQAAPYAVRVELKPARQRGCLVPSLQWLLAHRSLASITLTADSSQACTLSLQQVQLLGRLLAAHNPETSSKPMHTLRIRAVQLGQRFDAGMLASFRHLRRLELLWFASADLAGLPRSMHSVTLTLPGREFAIQLPLQLIAEQFEGMMQQALAAGGELAAAAAAAGQEAGGAVVGPAAGAEAEPLVLAGAAEQPEEQQEQQGPQPQPQPQPPQPQLQPLPQQPQQPPLPPMPPMPQPEQPLIAAASMALQCAMPMALLTAARVWLGVPLGVCPAFTALFAVAGFYLGWRLARYPALHLHAIMAAAGPGAPVAQAEVAAIQQQAAALLAQIEQQMEAVLAQGGLHPLYKWPPFKLRNLEIDGLELAVELPATALFAAARQVSVRAARLCLHLPADEAAQQAQQAPTVRRRPWWRFRCAAPTRSNTQVEAARRLRSMLPAFKLQAGGGSEAVLAAPQWRLCMAPNAVTALLAARQPEVVVLPGEQVEQLLRCDVARPPGVCVTGAAQALGRRRSAALCEAEFAAGGAMLSGTLV